MCLRNKANCNEIKEIVLQPDLWLWACAVFLEIETSQLQVSDCKVVFEFPTPVSGIMAWTRLVLIMCLVIGRTSCQNEKCAASIQGVGTIGCPSTWIQWEGNCYKPTGQALTWDLAREECVQMGGMMVVPQSDSETQFLLQFMPEAAGVFGSWILIDCNDIQVEGKY